MKKKSPKLSSTSQKLVDDLADKAESYGFQRARAVDPSVGFALTSSIQAKGKLEKRIRQLEQEAKRLRQQFKRVEGLG